MINIFGAIKTAVTIGKTKADVKKEIKKTKEVLRTEIKPLQTYVNEPNENNVEIGKLAVQVLKAKDEIIFLKNELKKQNTTIKKLKPNKKTADKKWYDE